MCVARKTVRGSSVFVFITAVPIQSCPRGEGIAEDMCYECVCLLLQYLLQSCSRGGVGDSGGNVLRETTSRGLCGLVCPSRTCERGGEGDCVKEGERGEGEREGERALRLQLYYSPRH